MKKLIRAKLSQRLYLQIWLAIVMALMLVSSLFIALWRLESEHQQSQRPGREIVIHNAQGEILGRSESQPVRIPGQGLEFEVTTKDGQDLFIILPRPQHPNNLRVQPWWRPPFDLGWLFVILTLGVALGTYPVVRRLTNRLEKLQLGVQQWGHGELHTRMNMTGDDEVASLARNFDQAANRVEELLTSHKLLLANASHELRSPLTRIRMSMGLIDHQPVEVTRAEIKRNILELDQLIDEILLASRLDASPQDLGTFETIDLVGLCAESCAQDDAQLILEENLEAAHVSGIHKLLRRILRNLIENAHRYAPGQVQVNLKTTSQGFAIQVSDQGPGVPMEHRQHVFEPFYRLPGASEQQGGVGLGLSLVKSIAQHHGGSVRCEDNPSGGACFIVELPRA